MSPKVRSTSSVGNLRGGRSRSSWRPRRSQTRRHGKKAKEAEGDTPVAHARYADNADKVNNYKASIHPTPDTLLPLGQLTASSRRRCCRRARPAVGPAGPAGPAGTGRAERPELARRRDDRLRGERDELEPDGRSGGGDVRAGVEGARRRLQRPDAKRPVVGLRATAGVGRRGRGERPVRQQRTGRVAGGCGSSTVPTAAGQTAGTTFFQAYAICGG